MVGVPRSNGCQTCLQRRVKCDLTRPECLQCSRRSTKCPGYEKRWKFYNETFGSMKKGLPGRSQAKPPARPRQAFQPPPTSGHSSAIARRASIDERVEPNLAVRALDLQGKEIFCSFIRTNFPAQFASCGNRVSVNWVDYARQPVPTAPQALVWAFRCIATLFMSRVYQDSEKATCSRHMYSRSLSYLADLVPDARYALLDETLATALLLSIYEMQDGVSASSLAHVRGLATMIQLRDPDAHRTGFGLTLLKSCRSLLVSEAFVRGGRCFLDNPEWQAFLTELVEEESQSATPSELGLLVDRAFIEITSCPRWLMETREIIQTPLGTIPSTSICPPTLINRMTQSRNRLLEFQHKLEIGVSRQGTPNSNGSWETFIGPIAVTFSDAFAQSSLNGIRLAIALLDQLLELVRGHLFLERHDDALSSISSSECPKSLVANPWTELGSHPGSWQVRFDPEYVQTAFHITPETTDWMDRIVMSMGMLGIRP